MQNALVFDCGGGGDRRTQREPCPYICDFSRGGLNVRLCARIQTLLRGHRYRGKALFWFWLFQYDSAIENV